MCNRKKGDRWKDASTRLFLNCYFDEIPEEQVLFVRFSLPTSGDMVESEFYLQRPLSGIDDILWSIMEKHVEGLQLSRRYKEELSVPISELRSRIRLLGLEQSGLINEEDVSQLTEREALICEENYGRNYWKTVVYRGIS
ncbi:MAG TPA: hypothetical protein PK765_05945 [bacterium]|nr:hypothetical protein [bacterium]